MAYENNISTVLNTNGIEMPAKIYDAIKKYKMRLSVSLDSSFREVHDFSRKQRSYNSLVSLIRNASQDGIPVRVITVLQEKNREELPEFAVFLKRLGVQSWFIQPLNEFKDGPTGLEKQISEISEAHSSLRIRFLPAIYDSFLYVLPDGQAGINLWSQDRKIYCKLPEQKIRELWGMHGHKSVADYAGLLKITYAPAHYD